MQSDVNQSMHKNNLTEGKLCIPGRDHWIKYPDHALLLFNHQYISKSEPKPYGEYIKSIKNRYIMTQK